MQCLEKRFYKSRKAGIIHIISSENYKGIIQTLLTPAEFIDYLLYREHLIKNFGEYLNTLPEQALVGHYVGENQLERPTISHAIHLQTIKHEIEKWDISGIICSFADRIIDTQNDIDYYSIIELLARLKRNELKEIKKRYILALEKARANEFDLPYRVAFPRIDCGFVFIPLEQDRVTSRRVAIKNFTYAHKYDCHLSKCIGITFAVDGEGYFTIDWCLIASPWEHDSEMENLLSENNPFREVRSRSVARYTFDGGLT